MFRPKLAELEIISTPDGELVPVYKNWEEWHNEYEVKMAYYTSIRPGVSKGPILHNKRKGLMTCISGEAKVVCLVDNSFESYNLVENNKKFVLLIPEKVPIEIINTSKKRDAVILNLPSRSWHPDDHDTVKFKDWDDYFSGVELQ